LSKSGAPSPRDKSRRRRSPDEYESEKFNTYRFADHTEKVIDLLMRVTRVSVETMNNR
jgi:hypothetical protein